MDLKMNKLEKQELSRRLQGQIKGGADFPKWECSCVRDSRGNDSTYGAWNVLYAVRAALEDDTLFG